MVMSTFGIYSSYKLKEKSSKFYPLLIQVPRGKMMTETKPLIASKKRLFYFYFRSFQRHRRARELTSVPERARSARKKKWPLQKIPYQIIMLFVCHPKTCISIVFSFSWGHFLPREIEDNAYAKFWGDKQRALWYVMVLSGVVNSPPLLPCTGCQ